MAATLVGGVEELVENGVSGATAPPRDSAALAEAMVSVMELSPIDRDAMAERGRLLVEERHGADAVVDAWEALIREVGRG